MELTKPAVVFAGAYGISNTLLKGRVMLNLDTEDLGEIFIGCAGSGDMHLTRSVQLQPAPSAVVPMEIKVRLLLVLNTSCALLWTLCCTLQSSAPHVESASRSLGI